MLGMPFVRDYITVHVVVDDISSRDLDHMFFMHMRLTDLSHAHINSDWLKPHA